MKALREAIAQIDKGEVVKADTLKTIFSEVEAEIAGLRAAVSVLLTNAQISGPDMDKVLNEYNRNNGNKTPGVTEATRRKIDEMAHALDEAIPSSDA